MKFSASRFLLFFIVLLLGLGADLWTKNWAFSTLGLPRVAEEPMWVIPSVFGFQTSLNHGALFGMGQGYGAVFCTISLISLILIMVWLFVLGYAQSRLWTFSLGMISAGVLGNLYDRMGLHGLRWSYAYENLYEVGDPIFAVRDWILVMLGSYPWPNFNIADALLVCGAGLVCLATFFMDAPASGDAAIPEQGKVSE